MRKVAIIDDFEESCQLISDILSVEFICQYVCDAQLAMQFILDFMPHLIIMDYKMPMVSGIDLCKSLKQVDTVKHIPIIFVSGAATSDERIETLEVGGDDFIAKPFHPKELLLRVKKRLVDYSAQGQMSLSFGNLEMDFESRSVVINGHEIGITPTQFEILKLLIESQGATVSRKTFMNEVWGHEDVTPRNVDSQINYLKKKLIGFKGEIVSEMGSGYRILVKN